MFFFFLFLIWPLNNYKHKHTVCKINNINTQVNTKQDKQLGHRKYNPNVMAMIKKSVFINTPYSFAIPIGEERVTWVCINPC